MAVLLHRIPFVHNHNAGTTVLFNAPCQPLILLGDPIKDINHQHTYIASVDGLETAIDTEELRPVIHAPAATNTSGVDQPPRSVLPNDARIDRVAGGPSNGADDGSLLTTDGIEQTGFAHIGSTDDRHLDRLFLVAFLILRRQEGQHLIEQISSAHTVDRRNRVGLSQTETPELSRHGKPLLRRLTLVHRQQRGAGTAAEKIRDRFICRCYSLLTIHDHYRHTCLLEGQRSLLADFRQKLAVVVEHQTTGVHHLEFTITPVTVLISPVPGYTRLVVNNRLSTATETVHQGGLANVGASDNGNDGTRHRARLGSIPDPTDPRNQRLVKATHEIQMRPPGTP